ncbi:MAG: squalene/phytoene synthase family protein, partial [Bacteroidota bacterium]
GVIEYCLNSANPVGRLVLLLFNYRSESLAELSDSICTALQLTNFWQDIRIDAGRDRIYVPAEDMKEFSYTEEELTNMTFNPEFKRLLSFEIERTRDLFLRGKPLLSEVGKDLAFELKLTWNGGMKILEKIERNHYDVFRNRPILTLSNKVGIFFSSLLA